MGQRSKIEWSFRGMVGEKRKHQPFSTGVRHEEHLLLQKERKTEFKTALSPDDHVRNYYNERLLKPMRFPGNETEIAEGNLGLLSQIVWRSLYFAAIHE